MADLIPPSAKVSGTQHGGRLALIEVILVTLIWSSSFVGVKFALGRTGPFTVAGLRYLLAFVLLVPWLWRGRAAVREYPRALWVRFALMGLAQYTVGNGALFWALRAISATAGSLVLSLVPILVLCLGILWLGERPRALQLVGVAGVNTLVAYLLYNHALQHLSAFEANVILNLFPLGTAALPTAFLGEQLLPMQIVAMLAVVAGVTLVARRKRWV